MHQYMFPTRVDENAHFYRNTFNDPVLYLNDHIEAHCMQGPLLGRRPFLWRGLYMNKTKNKYAIPIMTV